jgi:hypothetical protein
MAVQILGWLLAVFFVSRYLYGMYLSARFVIGGEWVEVVTALINFILLVWTVMYAFGGRTARLEQLNQSRGDA